MSSYLSVSQLYRLRGMNDPFCHTEVDIFAVWGRFPLSFSLLQSSVACLAFSSTSVESSTMFFSGKAVRAQAYLNRSSVFKQTLIILFGDQSCAANPGVCQVMLASHAQRIGGHDIGHVPCRQGHDCLYWSNLTTSYCSAISSRSRQYSKRKPGLSKSLSDRIHSFFPCVLFWKSAKTVLKRRWPLIAEGN